MKPLNYLHIALLFLLGYDQSAAQTAITCYAPEESSTPLAINCTALSHFIPDETTPVLIVRVAFHVIQHEAPLPKGNFDENDPDDVAFLQNTFNRLNELYTYGQEQWCNCGWVELGHTRDTRIRFELDDVYYHRDEVGYVNGNGTYNDSHNYDNYGSCKYEVLNVFFSNPPLAAASGVGFQSYIGMFNWYNEYQQGNANPWGTGNLLGHEIGHVFSLNHSFCGGLLADMCQSEPQDCQGDFCSNTSTDCTCGNNMMSYSRLADYISPLQMATMHRHLTTTDQSRFLKLDLLPTPIIIDQSGVLWDKARIIQSDVHIQPGASLTVACRLVMAKDARIIVKRGARLIVDGAVITSKGPTSNDCDNNEVLEFPRWLGIEVWGNTSVSTSTAMLSESFPLQTNDPGVVILKNNAKIERARIGIFPQQRGTAWEVQLEHFGGLISANNVEFKDCWKGVEYISHFPIRSSSRFINTRFTQNYLGTKLPFPLKTNFQGFSSWQVKGISFSDCDFLRLNSGITVLNADFTIDNSSLFQLSQKGIYIGTTTPGLGLLTEIGEFDHGNIFENCAVPISVFAYDLAEIDDNIIRSCPIDIYVEGQSGTIIQHNELRGNTSGDNPATSIGIALTQTGGGVRNLIRCNEWISTSPSSEIALIRDGILVHGDNRTTLFFDNKFHCKYDAKLVQYDEVDIPGILPNQALGGFPNIAAVYNEFTNHSIETHSNEIHTPDPAIPNGPLTLPFTYFHHPGTCENPNGSPPIAGSVYIPRRPVTGTCTTAQPPFNFMNRERSGSPQFTCPVIPPRPIIVMDGECLTLSCLEDLYPDIVHYNSILQSGDALSLYTGIQSNPNSSTTINALVAASPWLSEAILHAILSSTMTESNKLNVLQQNIPLSPGILAQAQSILSTQSYNYLLGLHSLGIISSRDSIQGNLISLINYKNSLLHHLVDSLVDLEEYSEAEDLLIADNGRSALEARVGLLIAKGDLTDAKQLISTWPSSEATDTEFSAIQEMYFEFAMNGNLPSGADSISLMDIALSSPHQASRAKSLLGVFYGILFDPVLPGEESQAFSMPLDPFVPVSDVSNSTFEIFPNPTGDLLQLNINKDVISDVKNDLTTVTIYDTKGTRMRIKNVTGLNAEIDVSIYPQGIYIITVHQGNQYLGVKRFIKR